MLFIKIAFSFPSLIPCPVLPRELRETTEGTPKEDHMTKKALFLRLSPKKVDFIPEKVVSLPKKVYSFPETIDLSVFKKKSPQKRFFLLSSKKYSNFASRNEPFFNLCVCISKQQIKMIPITD